MTRTLSIALLLCASMGHTATLISDGSLADVQSKWYAATAGDTITLPSGTFSWGGTLTGTNNVTLQGNGYGITIVTNTMTGGQVLINVTLSGGAGAYGSPAMTMRITGIEFQGAGPGLQLLDVVGSNADNRRIRLDHCKWNECGYWGAQFESAYGVVDHNVILGKTSGVPVWAWYIKGNYLFTGTTRNYGDSTWANPDNFGTESFIFFENNVYTNKYTSSELTMIDCVAGGRWCQRMETVVGGSDESHGEEDTRERSMRAAEIYGNTFIGFNVRSSPIYMRGGIGVVCSNTFDGWASGSVFSLLNNRSLGPNAAPFGGDSGNNVWDTNSASNPYVTGTASSAGSLTVTDSGKSWTVNQWAGFTVRKTSGVGILSGNITRSGSTVTVVTSAAHGFTNGASVSIWGANEFTWQNNIWGVGGGGITVINSTTFTFTDVNSAVPTGTGSGIKCALGGQFALIDSNTSTQLTFTASIHGTQHTLNFAAGSTYEINYVTHAMDQPGAGQGADLGGVLIPTLPSGGIAQALSPWYEWANTRNGGAIDFSNTRSGGTYPSIVSGTHFKNNTVKPGWTPYTYPHPLIALTDAKVHRISTARIGH